MTDVSASCTVVGPPIGYGLELFKNRREHFADLLQRLTRSGTRMVTIFGRRGIGKSALGAKVVDALSRDSSYFRGIVNLSSRVDGAITVERIFFSCCHLAPVAEREALHGLWGRHRSVRDKLTDLFEALGAERRILVVLDNFEDHLRSDGRLRDSDLAPFFDVIFRLPNAPRVLVTTQIPLALDPAFRRFEARLHLRQGLPIDDSVDLLLELDHDGTAGLTEASREELVLAADRLHGVPRALELIVGAIANDHLTLPTLNEIIDDYASRGSIVEQLAQRNLYELSEEERLTLDVLAVFRSPVTPEAVGWVMGPLTPGMDPARALARLADRYMVTRDPRTRTFTLHPMDADLAYAALDEHNPWGRRVLERRVAAWYAQQRQPQPWRSVDDVVQHRLEFEHRLRAEDYDDAVLLLDEIGEFLLWQGSVREVVNMYLAVGPKLRSDEGRLAYLIGLGLARHVGGPVADAVHLLEESLRLAERLPDRRQLSRALFSLGDLFRQTRQLQDAKRLLSRAADVAREVGDRYHEDHALLCLSLTHSYLGEAEAALEVADRLDRLAGETSDPMTRARASDARSAAYVVAGRWSEAIQAATESISAYQTAGVPEALGYARNTMGVAQLGMGLVDEAVHTLRQAWVEGRDVQIPRVQGMALYNTAWAHWTETRYEQAREVAGQAVAVFKVGGGVDGEVAQGLVRAVTARVAGELATTSTILREVAALSRGNTDLVPATWLEAEAERLAAETEQEDTTEGSAS
ncbi:tetratricopeptide repeat protein [Nonomuraea sp. NPDC046802]|uniref:tetratricopeptide repeat protein n=1 Tax=Nonomuraea sp. NPDC046802 TaxID=3154919 RepID=UPI00341059C0